MGFAAIVSSFPLERNQHDRSRRGDRPAEFLDGRSLGLQLCRLHAHGEIAQDCACAVFVQECIGQAGHIPGVVSEEHDQGAHAARSDITTGGRDLCSQRRTRRTSDLVRGLPPARPHHIVLAQFTRLEHSIPVGDEVLGILLSAADGQYERHGGGYCRESEASGAVGHSRRDRLSPQRLHIQFQGLAAHGVPVLIEHGPAVNGRRRHVHIKRRLLQPNLGEPAPVLLGIAEDKREVFRIEHDLERTVRLDFRCELRRKEARISSPGADHECRRRFRRACRRS